MGTVLLQLAGLYLLTSVFSYIQQNTMASVSQTLTLTLRREISEKLNRLPLRYFDRHKKGEVLSRATSDLEKVADTLQDSLSQLLTAFVSIVGSFVMMLLISPTLTLMALVAIAVSLIVAALVSRRTQRRFAANQEALGRLNAGIEEAFSGNIVIKAFNLEPQTVENTKKLNEDLFQAGKKAMFCNYVISPIIRLINQFGYVAIAIGGAMSVIRGAHFHRRHSGVYPVCQPGFRAGDADFLHGQHPARRDGGGGARVPAARRGGGSAGRGAAPIPDRAPRRSAL